MPLFLLPAPTNYKRYCQAGNGGRGVRRLALIAAGLLAASAGPAFAEPGFANGIYAPYVKKGVTEFEATSGALTGGRRSGDGGLILEVEHGFTDRLDLSVFSEIEHGSKTEIDSVGLEAVYYVGQVPGIGVDVGAYVDYEYSLDASDILETKLLLAKQAGSFHAVANLIAQIPTRNKARYQHDTDYQYGVQGAFDVAPNTQVGLQAFGDLAHNYASGGGRHNYVGPMANWELHPFGRPGELELQASYLFAVGSTRHVTNGQAHVSLEYEVRF